MTRDDARRILAASNPQVDDPQDPELLQALDLLETDPQLKAWFDQDRRFDEQIRNALATIEPPPDLHAQILARHASPPRTPVPWVTWGLAMAAAVALLLSAGGILWWNQHHAPVLAVTRNTNPAPALDTNDFSGYRRKMVGTISRVYEMDMKSASVSEIIRFLDAKGAPKVSLPAELAKTSGVGCALLKWKNTPVTLVCLKGKPNDDIFFFAVKSSALPDAPSWTRPRTARAGHYTTASWTEGGMTYLVAVWGGPEVLGKYLQADAQG